MPSELANRGRVTLGCHTPVKAINGMALRILPRRQNELGAAGRQDGEMRPLIHPRKETELTHFLAVGGSPSPTPPVFMNPVLGP